MKKIILIMILIFSGIMTGQSWNNLITTTINEPNLIQLDNLQTEMVFTL